MATTTISSSLIFLSFAKYFFIKVLWIDIGLLVVDKLGKISGWNISAYFTHEGQQLVNIGKVPPLLNLSKSSFASSMIVISAPKVTSNTKSKPSSLRALTILPSTNVPEFKPNSSPKLTLTAGAVIAIVTFFLLFIISSTSL